jgi:hypothetical protein
VPVPAPVEPPAEIELPVPLPLLPIDAPLEPGVAEPRHPRHGMQAAMRMRIPMGLVPLGFMPLGFMPVGFIRMGFISDSVAPSGPPATL